MMSSDRVSGRFSALILSCFALCLAFSFFPAFVSAQGMGKVDNTKIQKALQGQYLKMGAIYKKRDIQGLGSLFAEGSRQKGRMMGNFARMGGTIKPLSMSVNIQKLVVPEPGKAICSVTVIQKFLMPDKGAQYGPRGAEHFMVSRVEQEDTWTNSGGSWLLEKYADKRSTPTVTMDGKPFPPILPHKPGPRRP